MTMTNMQDKILLEIEGLAKISGLEFVQAKEYSNTGTVFFMKDMTSELTMVYDFQSRYATFEFYRKGVQPHKTIGYTHKDCILKIYLDYSANFISKLEEISKLVNTFAGSQST